jgi:integrase
LSKAQLGDEADRSTNTNKRFLNDKACRRPAPQTGQIEVWDSNCPGFGLRIAAGGSRTYFVMRRINGRLARRTVGKHPALHVTRDDLLGPGELWPEEARERARVMLADMARGIDPVLKTPKPATTKDQPAVTPPETFGEVAAAYFDDPSKRGGSGLRSKAELQRKVRVDLAAWNDRSIADITRADVRAVLKAKHTKSPVAANRLLALIRRIFRWAVREDLIPANPAMDIDPPAQESERDRVLAVDELRRIWQAAEEIGYPFGRIVQLLILTAQRRGEVAGMTRAELVAGPAWKLPDARAKRGKGHLIPLSLRAKEIIDDLPQIGGSPLLFTTGKRAAKKGEKVDPKAPPAPVSGWSRMKERLEIIVAEAAAKAADEPLDMDKHGLAPWTLHDIRRSVATHLRDAEVMGEARADRLTVSKILNHSEGGMTRLYDRYSADPEKKAALEAWAAVIERLWGLQAIELGEDRTAMPGGTQ